MVMLMKKPSHSWWLNSHNTPRRSQWLQSTLSELDEKTEAALKLIEEDADTFAQRAEMYYKKRPELISMVEDFYRAHRSLAERFDQFKSDNGTRLCTQLSSPLRGIAWLQRSMSPVERFYDSYSETFESEESEVGDPEPEKEGQIGTREAGDNRIQKAQLMEQDEEMSVLRGEMERLEEENRIWKAQLMENDGEMKVLGGEMERLKEEDRIQKAQLMEKDEEMKVLGGEMERLEEENRVQKAQLMEKDEEMKVWGGEMERLEEENRVQKAQLMEKDEEKREVIRQLSLAIKILKEENVDLKERLPKEVESKKKPPFNLNKLNDEMKVLRGEIERLEEENRIWKAIQIDQLMEKDEEMKVWGGELERLEEENRIQKAQLMENDEEMKVLRGEMERVEEENRIQKAQLMEKDEEMKVLGGEMERVEEESMIQKAQLMEKDEEIKVLGGEMERLEEEIRIQKAQLMDKDEEKREMIRRLSLEMDTLKEENLDLKKSLAKEEESKKKSSFDLNRLKEGFTRKLFSGSSPLLYWHHRSEPDIDWPIPKEVLQSPDQVFLRYQRDSKRN